MPFFDLDPQAANLASRHLTAICFVLAAGAAVFAKRFWLSGLMAFGAVESYQLWRFELHNRVKALLMHLFPGYDHIAVQTGLIIAATGPALALFVIYLSIMRRVGRGRRIAVTGIYALLAMLAVELVSQDDLERYVYMLVGPFVVFTWWIAGTALMVAAGCLAEARDAARLAPATPA